MAPLKEVKLETMCQADTHPHPLRRVCRPSGLALGSRSSLFAVVPLADNRRWAGVSISLLSAHESH